MDFVKSGSEDIFKENGIVVVKMATLNGVVNADAVANVLANEIRYLDLLTLKFNTFITSFKKIKCYLRLNIEHFYSGQQPLSMVLQGFAPSLFVFKMFSSDLRNHSIQLFSRICPNWLQVQVVIQTQFQA